MIHPNHQLNLWLRILGSRVIMSILEQPPDPAILPERELYWIQTLRDAGNHLFNAYPKTKDR